MTYNYTLQKGSRKMICPNCHKKTFTPYVNTSTGEMAGSKYGFCDRINSCKYNLYPRAKVDDIESSRYVAREIVLPKPVEYVDKKIVEATFNNYRENVFFMYLVKTFGIDKAYELAEMYNIGTAKNGGTIFWQQDAEGKFRTGKVMYYKADGHRNKDRASWFVHKKIREDFNFKQCFFGLNLVDRSKPVALCESEKTAVMMSVYQPEYTWIASGGSEMLSYNRLEELKRLDMVYADNGQFDKWAHKTRFFKCRDMDTSVDRAVKEGIIDEGADILDLVMAKEHMITTQCNAM